jgi:hypothetical protein
MAAQTMAATVCDIHHIKAITPYSSVYNVESSFHSNKIPSDRAMSRQHVLETANAPLQRGYRETPTSPTVTPFRIHWREISEWTTYREDVFQFMNSLPPRELAAIVDPDHTVDTRHRSLTGLSPPTAELGLMLPLHILFHGPHNVAAEPIGARDRHAQIEPYQSASFRGFVGDPDYGFIYNERVVGAVELKTFWSVTARQIDEVLNGIDSNGF